MRSLIAIFVATVPFLSFAQAPADPVFDAFKAFQRENTGINYAERQKKLYTVSAEWVAKYPDSKSAWRFRREALVSNHDASAEDWKQAGDNLIRLSPPHSWAALAAYDWMAAHVNVPEARTLIAGEIEWQESRPRPSPSTRPTLGELVEEAQFASRLFSPLLTLAQIQIQLKEFDGARATIARVHDWLEGDFKRYYDQDPLEAFPDYIAKYPLLSAKLAEAEGKNPDALAFYQQLLTSPYFQREYKTRLGADTLWKKLGGSEEGFALFAKTSEMPAGVPAGYPGFSFSPWYVANFKLPELFGPGPDAASHTWTVRDFAGKTTLVYIWSINYGCGGPCKDSLGALQALYARIKTRNDIQVVALSKDTDPGTVAAYMQANGYSFPVMISKSYAESLFPGPMAGEDFIVDGSGTVRLLRMQSHFGGVPQAYVDEAVYKLTHILAPAISTASR